MAVELAAFSPRDAERIARSVRAYEAGPSGLLTPSRFQAHDRNLAIIPFRNDFAGTIPARGCCRITGTVEVDGLQFFKVDRPDTSFGRLYLVNGPEDVADDGYGWGTFLWHADWVLYDDASTPAFGESWGPQNGSFEIKKWRYGFEIWGSPSGGTTDLVMASQRWVNQFLCKANETITANGDTGAVSVYDGNQADITGTDVTCTNLTGFAFTINTWGTATWLGGTWFAEPWECP